MKRLIVAMMVGGMVFGVVFGAAAALNVTANDLQAGADTDLKCDDDGVQIYWRDGWEDGDVDDFTITDVVVGGVANDCDGLLLEVVLTDINGNWLAQGAVTISMPGPNPVVPVDTGPPNYDHPLASAVEDVHVIIR